jgi:hypothetical protein
MVVEERVVREDVPWLPKSERGLTLAPTSCGHLRTTPTSVLANRAHVDSDGVVERYACCIVALPWPWLSYAGCEVLHDRHVCG